MNKGYSFTSDLFQIQTGEDAETNPGCYGKELGEWLCKKLKHAGYDTELIPEDWGWCVMCSSRDYLLWVGCGAEQREEFFEKYDSESPPRGQDIVWHVFPHVEVPFFYIKSLFRRLMGRLDLKSPLNALDKELEKILTAEPGIAIQDEP